MTVLVTGGTGVVGRQLVARLLEDDRSVRVLARSDEAAAIITGLGAEPVAGDVRDRTSVEAAVRDCEIVYHAAGKVQFCPRDPTEMFAVNVEGTRTVVAAARQAGVRRLIHTSSTVTLGEQRGSTGSESTEHRGRFLTRYEESKVIAERIAFAESGSVEVVAVNPASVQGPGRSTGTGRILLDAVNGELPVMVDTTFSIVDVADCAEGHVLAERHGVPGQRYVLSGFTIGVRQALAMLGELTDQAPRVRVLPAWLVAPFGPLADLVGRFIDSVPVCAESLRQMRAGARYDGSRASRDLGLTYHSPQETFNRILEWFRSEGLTER